MEKGRGVLSWAVRASWEDDVRWRLKRDVGKLLKLRKEPPISVYGSCWTYHCYFFHCFSRPFLVMVCRHGDDQLLGLARVLMPERKFSQAYWKSCSSFMVNLRSKWLAMATDECTYTVSM